jgi:hypothetical protein
MRAALLQPTQPSVIHVPPIVRPPLPLPLPRADRDGVPWADGLPWDGGQAPTSRDYCRADAWGVVVDGAPWVPGASSAYPERILTWFLDRWSLEWQRRILTTYAGLGYTHFFLSVADSLADVNQPAGSPPGAGKSLSEFRSTCELVKSYGLYVAVMLGSKYFATFPREPGLYCPHDMDPGQWAAYADPLLDALLPVVDEVVPAWEWNLWCRTAPDAITAIKHIGDRCHAAGVSCWLHFSPHYTSWFADGDPRGRFGFYDDLNTSIDGLNYQGVSDWTTQDAADRAVDTLWQFAQQPYGHKFRYWEDLAFVMFDGNPQRGTPPAYTDGVARGPACTPEDANCRGWYLMSTYDNVKGTDGKIWGFGNGGRRPDGSRI